MFEHTTGAIGYYEAIHAASQRRLDAARRRDWQQLYDLDDDCSRLIGLLAISGARKRLGPTERRRRREILHEILAEDAAVRAILYPSLARLDRRLARNVEPDSDPAMMCHERQQGAGAAREPGRPGRE